MRKLVMIALFLLIACQTPQKMMVQCWDGSVVESLESCPLREETPKAIPVSTPPIEVVSVPETVQPEPVIATQPESKSVMRQLLDAAPTNYWFSDEKYGAIVSGSKRSTGEYNQWLEYFFVILYWDMNNKNEKGEYVLYLQAGRPIPDVWWQEHITGKEQRGGGLDKKYHTAFFQLNLTGNKEVDEKKIPKELNRYYYEAKEGELTRIIETFYRKSPLDWMQEYVDEVPISIDTQATEMPFSMGMTRTSMAITYAHKEKPGHTIVFYVHSGYKLPLIIDEKLGADIVSRTSYFYDTVYTKEGKLKVPITEKIVTLPEDYIIVTPKEYQEFLDELEGQY